MTDKPTPPAPSETQRALIWADKEIKKFEQIAEYYERNGLKERAFSAREHLEILYSVRAALQQTEGK